MTVDGDWYDLWAENDYKEWIERYRTVQYYALFDRKRNGRYFVGSEEFLFLQSTFPYDKI